MESKIKDDNTDFLFDCILKLETMEDCYAFFEDLCTINELQSLAQRLEVAGQLRSGRTYMEISEATGASTATISRVNRSLNYGNDSYAMVLGRLNSAGKDEEEQG